MEHELKTWPRYFDAVATGIKTFELRKADREFEVGDTLRLVEWHTDKEERTGRQCLVAVTYVLHGPAFGLDAGHCIMSIKVIW